LQKAVGQRKSTRELTHRKRVGGTKGCGNEHLTLNEASKKTDPCREEILRDRVNQARGTGISGGGNKKRGVPQVLSTPEQPYHIKALTAYRSRVRKGACLRSGVKRPLGQKEKKTGTERFDLSVQGKRKWVIGFT